MAEHNDFGRLGEYEACLYLAERGYTLLERNWQAGHLEIDIIADYFGELVFVEVKTRHSEWFEPAIKAVDRAKQRHIIKAARAYMAIHHNSRPFRYDIITVVGTKGNFEIKQYFNAFRAARNYGRLRYW